MISVREIRRAGRDMRVARYARHAALRLRDVFRRRARLVRRRSQARGLSAAAAQARRQARSFRSLLSLGRRAGEKWRRFVADRRAARRRPALRAPRARDRRTLRSPPPPASGPSRSTSLGAGDPGQGDRAGNRGHEPRGSPARVAASRGGLAIYSGAVVFFALRLKAGGVRRGGLQKRPRARTPIFASSTMGCA